MGATVARTRMLETAASGEADGSAAVSEVLGRLPRDAGLYVAMIGPGHDPDAVATALDAGLGGEVVGCTTAGNVGAGGYVDGGLQVTALAGPDLRVATALVGLGPRHEDEPARDDLEHVEELAAGFDQDHSFALLFIDALARAEEHLTAALSLALGGIPLIGGSAGDALAFTDTPVLHGGRVHRGAAAVAIVETAAPFETFRLQHHRGGEHRLVVTAASPDDRLVHEINGRRADLEYADLVGVPVGDLDPSVFSTHPIVFRASGGDWVRSIQQIEPDGSIRFFCAIEPGLVMRLGQSGDQVGAVAEEFERLDQQLGGVEGAFVFDCILRRLEYERGDLVDVMGSALADRNVVGWSTYGEQFNGMHVNQTMVGVAFGRERDA